MRRKDFQPAYLEDLARKVNLDAIRKAGLKVVYDPLYGAARGYLDGLLSRHGVAGLQVRLDHRLFERRQRLDHLLDLP